MKQNNTVVVRVKADARQAELALARSMHATASHLHQLAATAYRNALHRHGAAHATTRDAQKVATALSFYLTDARTRLARCTAATA